MPRPIADLFQTNTLPTLGPERRPEALSLPDCQAQLEALELTLQQRPLVHSALLLWHDHLGASHDISQGIQNSDGSFLHGIMHRREPDYSNAKYWFTLTGEHPSFAAIHSRAKAILKETALSNYANPNWDPHAAVDAISQAEPGSDEYAVWQEVQRIEFEELLKRFCR